jgi:hypothetical protein
MSVFLIVYAMYMRTDDEQWLRMFRITTSSSP